MESEKKRKRSEKREAKSGERRRQEAEAPVKAPPEEEVEEFFAILRRMQVAVKYFEKNGGNIDDAIAGDERKSTLLESGVNKVGEKRSSGALDLDLNAVPEAE